MLGAERKRVRSRGQVAFGSSKASNSKLTPFGEIRFRSHLCLKYLGKCSHCGSAGTQDLLKTSETCKEKAFSNPILLASILRRDIDNLYAN